MITNLEKLIECCRDELADREYANQRARNIETEWNKILQWYKKQGFARYCSHPGDLKSQLKSNLLEEKIFFKLCFIKDKYGIF